jgi:hypothetical protein
MIDPFAANEQPDVPADTVSTAISSAQTTYNRDVAVLSTLELYDGSHFFNTNTNLPTYYGDGTFPNYIESGAGQYIVDTNNVKRGPRYDAQAKHKTYYSRFHESKYFCQSCHDVSNPILASVALGADTPETDAPQSYYHVERTSSEFMLSAYGSGGASTNIPGVSWADSCQDCHMRAVTGKACNKRVDTRTDLALHDFTGGNQWVLKILASADQSSTAYDQYNYDILSGQKYSGASIDTTGLQSYGDELLDGSDRAIQQLEMAATLSITGEDTASATIKVQNNGGHKLISGFPEGRRMFLNVKFFDSTGNQISEINPYSPLVTQLDTDGNEAYVSGGVLTKTDEKLVWEAEMSSSITDETKSFHFALADGRYKDNRIPPKGFDTTNMNARMAQPVWEGVDAPDYFTAAEYAGGYDEVTISKPTGTTTWYATLYYQTTSKEYVEFLRDEINGDASTLPSSSYIIQTDPFFSNLKGWGDAMYDLWLHNGGAEPVLMETIGDSPAPPCNIDTPENLNAAGGKRSITLTWDAVTDAEGYNIYFSQGGKYTFVKSTTSTSIKITKLQSRQTFCYAVTAYKTCDENPLESDYSNEACATTR